MTLQQLDDYVVVNDVHRSNLGVNSKKKKNYWKQTRKFQTNDAHKTSPIVVREFLSRKKYTI